MILCIELSYYLYLFDIIKVVSGGRPNFSILLYTSLRPHGKGSVTAATGAIVIQTKLRMKLRTNGSYYGRRCIGRSLKESRIRDFPNGRLVERLVEGYI